MKFVIWISAILISIIHADVIQLTNNNIKTVLEENELVLVDFYANWCYFSNILDPIFTDASNKLELDFKDKGKIALAKVDCEHEPDLARIYGIRKYPTLKLFRFGEVCKREYRGARNADSFVEYIKSEMENPIKELESNGLIARELGKSYLIGHFQSKSGHNYDLFKRIGYLMRDVCDLYFQITPDIPVEKLTYESFETEPIVFTELSDLEYTRQWILKVCTPIVRNITFKNAEDITEEGLPLVLLFYNSDNEIITSPYVKLITDHMTKERESVNFVYADGKIFAHPLSHLDKTEKDLPLIVIDSFKHMFVLPAKVDEVLNDPNILKQFIADLHSGKLHRQFHNGPDLVPEGAESEHLKSGQNPHDNSHDSHDHEDTTPVPSVFKKLRPNSNRYTLFHDEF